MTRFFDNAFLHKFNQNQNFNGQLLRTDFCEIAGKRARARARTSFVQITCDRLAFRNVGSQLNYAHAFFSFFCQKNWPKFFSSIKFPFFNISKKWKKAVGVIVVSLRFEKLTDRTQIERTRSARARVCPLFHRNPFWVIVRWNSDFGWIYEETRYRKNASFENRRRYTIPIFSYI